MMYNDKSHHIRRRHNTVRELLSSGIITVNYVKSKDNVSDSLTKGLSREGVERTSKGTGLRPRTSQHGVCANLEFRCTSNKKQPCPWWLRTGLRIFFGCLAFFISVEFPFLPSLAGLISAIPKLWAMSIEYHVGAQSSYQPNIDNMAIQLLCTSNGMRLSGITPSVEDDILAFCLPSNSKFPQSAAINPSPEGTAVAG
ncbi:hypothetical protein CQW23_11094 [Capsicum baccatum]|uniref:Uncharacterized protein n=1 Tax=Capsicum baccatum TaxID=33114 RepID=A0A2G2X1I0_CAPBA|nr:hypothetical protein CQW23_11094 [Capsicum baccatum]